VLGGSESIPLNRWIGHYRRNIFYYEFFQSFLALVTNEWLTGNVWVCFSFITILNFISSCRFQRSTEKLQLTATRSAPIRTEKLTMLLLLGPPYWDWKWRTLYSWLLVQTSAFLLEVASASTPFQVPSIWYVEHSMCFYSSSFASI